jgi:hypothetical protein
MKGGLAYDSTIARAGRCDAAAIVPPKGSPKALAALAATEAFLGRTHDGRPLDFHVAASHSGGFETLHVPARAAALRPDAAPGRRVPERTAVHGINTD